MITKKIEYSRVSVRETLSILSKICTLVTNNLPLLEFVVKGNLSTRPVLSQ